MRTKSLHHAGTRALSVSLVLVSALLFSCGTFGGGLDEPGYEVKKEFESFELRRYSGYLVAQVELDESFEEAGGEAHGPLFDYISGNNRGQEKIEMTVPVNQKPAEDGEKIEMTVPVNQRPTGDGKFIVQFVMPERYTLETLPEPLDPSVKLVEEPGKLMAVRSYSGGWSRELYDENESALLEAIKAAGLKPVGQPTWARYNPPWTPWFMRRNEILLEVEPIMIK